PSGTRGVRPKTKTKAAWTRTTRNTTDRARRKFHDIPALNNATLFPNVQSEIIIPRVFAAHARPPPCSGPLHLETKTSKHKGATAKCLTFLPHSVLREQNTLSTLR
ncbi:unnamed protein product, partial [Ectocarpus fasciculatus]